MLVLMRFLFVARVVVLMGAMLTRLVLMFMLGATSCVSMFLLMHMGVRMFVKMLMGVAVGDITMGVGMFMLMLVSMGVFVSVLMLSFHSHPPFSKFDAGNVWSNLYHENNRSHFSPKIDVYSTTIKITYRYFLTKISRAMLASMANSEKPTRKIYDGNIWRRTTRLPGRTPMAMSFCIFRSSSVWI